MTDNGKSQIQTIVSAMLGFVLVVGVGALAVMSRGGSAKSPSSASHPSSIPTAPAAEPALPAAAPAAAGVAGASSPQPVLPSVMADKVSQEAASSEPAAQPAVSPKPAALVVTQHLEATQTTSAKVEVAAAPAAPAAKKMEPLATREFVTPKLAPTKNAGIASSVHYGVSSRSELMGRAAGPVYNFKGRGAKKADASGSKIGGEAATQIEEAQRQVEGSALDEKAKKDLRETFQLVNDSVGKTGSN